MLTIFAMPKPFEGHIATIQRNAITSWTLLNPRPEIILFGEENGVSEIARELGLRHIPKVNRNEYGTPLLNDLFDSAQNLAVNSIVCYVNADIVLLSDFSAAVKQIVSWRPRFLMIGRRWDVDITEPLNFSQAGWELPLFFSERFSEHPTGSTISSFLEVSTKGSPRSRLAGFGGTIGSFGRRFRLERRLWTRPRTF